MSITSSAVLVELNLSVWTANKLDKRASSGLVSEANAVYDAAVVRKNLMAGTSKRKAISDYAANCRLWHNTRTLPWADRGARLLPTSMFMEYKSEANIRRDTFNAMVDDFKAHYPALVQTANNYLGTLFDAADYPDVSELEDKFNFRLVFSPVPDSGDFRLDIAQQDLAQIQKDYEANFNDRIADAMREPWEKLHSMVSRMSEKLTDVEGDDETKKRYHDSLVTNPIELCDLLGHLNITKDPELERARVELKHVMEGTNIEVIKNSSDERREVKEKLDQILKQYSW
tara:strand:+ start:763 stop:1620 length:858 start_codon:yes stop_codon:yes gene_type:complete